ncbi:MAG: uroporphyrinogen-III synthase, partial [Planctomycetota bacterium]
AIDARRVAADPAFVAVTSQNALAALKRLWAERPDVKDAPHAAVGVATARALRVLGVDPALVGPSADAGAKALAEGLVERTERGQSVLWPRGSRAEDLRDLLQRAGRAVDAPVAYRTVDVEGSVLPKRLDAAFFASPSAVQVWLRAPDAPRVTAVAIGQTTQSELAPEYARFRRIVRLDEPSPRALRTALERLTSGAS